MDASIFFGGWFVAWAYLTFWYDDGYCIKNISNPLDFLFMVTFNVMASFFWPVLLPFIIWEKLTETSIRKASSSSKKKNNLVDYQIFSHCITAFNASSRRVIIQKDHNLHPAPPSNVVA